MFHYFERNTCEGNGPIVVRALSVPAFVNRDYFGHLPVVRNGAQ